MNDYLIKEDVYFCYAGTQVVFLDLERGRYSAIDRKQAPALTGTVAGWEVPEPNTDSVEDTIVGKRMRKQTVESLLGLGILTRSQKTGKKATPTRFSRPTADLLSEYESNKPSIGLLHITRFIKSYLYAVVSLRVLSLARIAHQIEAHRGQIGQRPPRGSVAKARELVLVYDHLRPFFFGASDKCLLNSLVLMKFFRHYNVFPTWVIGVSTNPFRAHSWLEVNRFVVDDQAIHVNNYVPIMAL